MAEREGTTAVGLVVVKPARVDGSDAVDRHSRLCGVMKPV